MRQHLLQGPLRPGDDFPKVKWLGLPPVLLGITQALAHGAMSARIARDDSRARYSPGTLTAVLLHLPISITYLRALRAQGPARVRSCPRERRSRRVLQWRLAITTRRHGAGRNVFIETPEW